METAQQKEAIDVRIISFVDSQTNLTLAVCEDNNPYCANCFYAYDAERNSLIFKSKSDTTHILIGMKNSLVAGTIIPDSLDKTRIRGVQFTGRLLRSSGSKLMTTQAVYYKKFPFALTISGDLWIIELATIKFTDNKLGFGKKLIWKNK